MPRQYCLKCSKPQTACICRYLCSQDNKKAVIILQHPDEQNKALGTANLIALGLSSSYVLTSINISNTQVKKILEDMACSRPILIYPKALGEGSVHHAHDFEKDHSTALDLKNGYDSIILLDGTWRNTRELLHCNGWIKTLPTLCLENAGASRYRIRQAQEQGALATVEAVSKVLELIEDDFESEKLLQPFEKMIEFQISQMGRKVYQKNYLDNKKPK